MLSNVKQAARTFGNVFWMIDDKQPINLNALNHACESLKEIEFEDYFKLDQLELIHLLYGATTCRAVIECLNR